MRSMSVASTGPVHVVESALDLTDLGNNPQPPTTAKPSGAGPSPARQKRLAKGEMQARRAGRKKILEFRKARRKHFTAHGCDPEYFPRRELWRWNDRSETATSFATAMNHSPEAVSPGSTSPLSPKERQRRAHASRRSTLGGSVATHARTTKHEASKGDENRRFSSATMNHAESIASLKKSAEFSQWKKDQDKAKQQAQGGGYHRRVDPGAYLAEYQRTKKSVLAKRWATDPEPDAAALAEAAAAEAAAAEAERRRKEEEAHQRRGSISSENAAPKRPNEQS